MRTFLRVLPITVLVVPACSDAGAVGDRDEVAAGWRSTNLALSEHEEDLEVELEAGSGRVVLECAEGGSLDVSGQYDGEDTFDLSVEFDGCTADDVTIDGTLDFSAEIEATDDSARVDVVYAGTLTWTGRIEGTCDIDVIAHVAASSTQEMASAEASIEGSICGHDAEVIAKASAG